MHSQVFQKLKLPNTPGVYFFIRGAGAGREALYIGKATSLADRVKSYFSPDLLAARGEYIARMVEEADTVEWERADSVLEALLREAALIKKYQPRYNAIGKDDKSFNHVVITNEPYPRVLTLRGKDLAAIAEGRMAHTLTRRDLKWTFGPFTSGGALKEALALVRKIFPFRDACVPCEEQSSRTGRTGKLAGPGYRLPVTGPSCVPCFNAQLGLCPGVCSGAITRKDYNRTIQHIRLFFEGKKKTLVRELERDMRVFARQQEFEKAAEVKRMLWALGHIQDVALLKQDSSGKHAAVSVWVSPAAQNSKSEVRNTTTTQARNLHDQNSGIRTENAVTKTWRIEAYDVAHFGGEETVGVMVVVERGEPEKSAYRKFRIRSDRRGSDTDALREVLLRRLAHGEWPLPRLIVVDGGEQQIAVAERAFRAHFGEDAPLVPIVGVVKDARHRPREIRASRALPRQSARALVAEHERAILFANAEAHRFAIAFHRKRRSNAMR